jgi:hypothetical protein
MEAGLLISFVLAGMVAGAMWGLAAVLILGDGER